MSAEPLTLCLLVSSDDAPRPYQTEPDLTRRARIMALDPDGTPRNITAGSSHYDERAPYADLAADAKTYLYNSADPTGPRHQCYWRLRFEPVLGAELSELEPVMVTMRRVQRHLDKLAARYGQPQTFGQYVARLADALRISIALRRTGGRADWLSDGEYATMSPADAGEWLDAEDRRWRERHPNPAPDAAP